MSSEYKKLENEVQELRNELNTLKSALGISKNHKNEPQDIICNSLKISKDENVLVYLGDFGNKGKSGIIQLSCANGNRIQIQGRYYQEAIRMYANNTNELLFSLGGNGNNGNIKVFNTTTKSQSQLRVVEAAGIIETYDSDGNLSMRMT